MIMCWNGLRDSSNRRTATSGKYGLVEFETTRGLA